MAENIDNKIARFLWWGQNKTYDQQKQESIERVQGWHDGKGAMGTVFAVGGAAASAVEGSFDIIIWLKNNWQIAVIGAVALLVLLKD